MPFNKIFFSNSSFIVKQLSAEPQTRRSIIILSDCSLDAAREKLLENFSKIASRVVLVMPLDTPPALLTRELAEQVASLMKEEDENYLIAFGSSSPIVVLHSPEFKALGKAVFINPEFVPEMALKMSSFDRPSLVVTSTVKSLDYNPDSVKYHDLMANSSIQYVRGTSGNPLFEKFTQSFNSIQRFLLDE